MSYLVSTDVEVNLATNEPAGGATLCQSCAATKGWVRARRLMVRADVNDYLALSHEQVQSLIDTRQITLIRIKGEDRFDSKDLDLLVEMYKQTACRRA
jgi:hypothetical protein